MNLNIVYYEKCVWKYQRVICLREGSKLKVLYSNLKKNVNNSDLVEFTQFLMNSSRSLEKNEIILRCCGVFRWMTFFWGGGLCSVSLIGFWVWLNPLSVSDYEKIFSLCPLFAEFFYLFMYLRLLFLREIFFGLTKFNIILRRNKKMSQSNKLKLQKKTAISNGRISRFEQGKKRPLIPVYLKKFPQYSQKDNFRLEVGFFFAQISFFVRKKFVFKNSYSMAKPFFFSWSVPVGWRPILM